MICYILDKYAYFCSGLGSELKRKLEDAFSPDEVKRKKIEGDVSSDLISDIVSHITEPELLVGPDVSVSFDQ